MGVSIKKMLRKNAVVLMVPYFIWGIIYAKFSFYNIGGIYNDSSL